MRIALLEDDPLQSRLISEWLETDGHHCQCFAEGQKLISQLKRESYDLLILDWMLEGIDGQDVLQWLRKNTQGWTPVLFMTARKSEQDIAQILNTGADDYMVKPVNRVEVLARVTALTRRLNQYSIELLKVGEFDIDTQQRTILRHNELLSLTNKEFDLASFILRNTNRLLSRNHIYERVWGGNPDVDTRTVDTYMSRLRNKLLLKPEHGWQLTSVYQVGYRLDKITNEQKEK